MKPRGFSVLIPSRIVVTSLAALAAAALTATPALAADGTFSNTAGGNWATTTNWSPSGTVGAAHATAPIVFDNNDAATFTAGGANTSIAVTDSSPFRNLRQIIFLNNTNTLANHTIGSSSNTIYLTSYAGDVTTGNILVTGTSTSGSSQTIASNLMITAASGLDKNDLRIATSDGFNGTLTLSGNISSTATSGISSIRIITSSSSVSTANNNINNRVVLSGIISDGGGTNKVSISRGRNGVLLITGANTYSGGFQLGADTNNESVNAVTQIGVDSVGSVGAITSGAFGTGTLTLRAGTLSSNSTTARTILNPFAFTGGVVYLGTTTNNGSLTFAAAGTLATGTSMVTHAPVTFSGILSDAGGLYKGGSAALTLAGQNTYAGTTTANTGIIIAGNNSALGSTAGKTIVNSGAALHLASGITITGETLDLAGDGLEFQGSLAALSGTATWAGTVNLTANSRVGAIGNANLIISGGITGAFNLSTNSGLNTSGGGSVTLSAPSGQNTYTGVTNILRGTLKLGADDTLPSGTIVDVDSSSAAENAVFDLNGYNQTVAGIRRSGFNSGSGTSTITNSAAGPVKTLTLNQAADSTYTGTLSGNLAITKTGTGTLTLVGSGTANSYTGATTVSAGKLIVNALQPLATGAVTVAAGATLGGTGTLGGATTISGIHAPGNSPGIQRFSSSLTYASGSTFSWELASETTTGRGTNFDGVIVNGALAINNSTFQINISNLNLNSAFWDTDKSWDVFDAGSTSGSFFQFVLYDTSTSTTTPVNYSSYGSFSFNAANGNLNWTAVPEPTNALAGLLVAAGLLRRKRCGRAAV